MCPVNAVYITGAAVEEDEECEEEPFCYGPVYYRNGMGIIPCFPPVCTHEGEHDCYFGKDLCWISATVPGLGIVLILDDRRGDICKPHVTQMCCSRTTIFGEGFVMLLDRSKGPYITDQQVSFHRITHEITFDGWQDDPCTDILVASSSLGTFEKGVVKLYPSLKPAK